MKKVLFIAILAACIVVIFACVTAFADNDYEKYNKYMGKYYKHLDEAEEERQEGDWDDYREEMEKAQKDWHKAQKYYNRIYGYSYYRNDNDYAPPRQYHERRGYSYRPRSYRPYSYHGYGCGGCGSCGKKRDFFFGLDLDFDF